MFLAVLNILLLLFPTQSLNYCANYKSPQCDTYCTEPFSNYSIGLRKTITNTGICWGFSKIPLTCTELVKDLNCPILTLPSIDVPVARSSYCPDKQTIDLEHVQFNQDSYAPYCNFVAQLNCLVGTLSTNGSVPIETRNCIENQLITAYPVLSLNLGSIYSYGLFVNTALVNLNVSVSRIITLRNLKITSGLLLVADTNNVGANLANVLVTESIQYGLGSLVTNSTLSTISTCSATGNTLGSTTLPIGAQYLLQAINWICNVLGKYQWETIKTVNGTMYWTGDISRCEHSMKYTLASLSSLSAASVSVYSHTGFNMFTQYNGVLCKVIRSFNNHIPAIQFYTQYGILDNPKCNSSIPLISPGGFVNSPC